LGRRVVSEENLHTFDYIFDDLGTCCGGSVVSEFKEIVVSCFDDVDSKIGKRRATLLEITGGLVKPSCFLKICFNIWGYS